MEQQREDQVGDTLSARLTTLARTLSTDPEETLTGAGEILDEMPGQQQALLLLVSALQLLNNGEGAKGLLELLANQYPKLAAVQYEIGLMLSRLGLQEQAIGRLNSVVGLEPNHANAWRALGNLHVQLGDRTAAADAYKRHARLTLHEVKLLEDAVEAGKESLVKAENMLHVSLDVNGTDVSLVRTLGRIYTMLGDYYRARQQFLRALELTPGSIIARDNYVESLYQGMQWREAAKQLDLLMEANPGNIAQYKARKAHNLVMLGDIDKAFALIDEVSPELGHLAPFWLNVGHSLRTVGKAREAVDAYKKSVALDPEFGPAWLALANLKTYRFSQADIEKMLVTLKRDLDENSRVQLEFAVGQALEDRKEYADSFEHYCTANALRRRQVHFSSEGNAENLKRWKKFFTRQFFQARKGLGCPSPDPIFIVGMVRAGSTLIEQILSSHSLVEGTMELPELGNVVAELVTQRPGEDIPELMADLDASTLRALGERYLETTRTRRHLDRPFFTDKSGTNLWRVGIIEVILPNAKIIDARRHPLGCCFSTFKQNFPGASTPHSYDLSELGHYYRDYVEMMAHFDEVLPGRVHRVFHEDMVRDPEDQIRRLLDYCGLPFEEQCLRFYETKRSVGTFSSEQVRKPVSAGTSEQWRHFEPWLDPLKAALGDVLTDYPAVPDFSRK